MTTAAVVIYFFFLAFFIGLPVFLASFLAAVIPFAEYENSFFPTIGILFAFLVACGYCFSLATCIGFRRSTPSL